ncbi:MAG: hypothetical protein AAGE83_01735 [Pseudomonadota bacterium]
MKKTGKAKPRKRAAKTGAARQPAKMDRRALLGWLKVGGVAAVALGGVGYFTVSSVMATIAEHDLSRIGQGKPAVVQIHDPNCTMCITLQREARAALSEMEPEALDYVVANIRTADGRAYANRHNARHVTLLLVDGRGRVRQVLEGPNTRETLAPAFAEHAARAARTN